MNLAHPRLNPYSLSYEPSIQPESDLASENHACQSIGVTPLTKMVVAANFGFAGLLATHFQPSIWFQPTCVGVLWAGLFFAGFVLGSVGRGSGLAVLLTLGYSATANSAFANITDISAVDSLLFVAMLLAAGWVVARIEFHVPTSFMANQKGRLSISDLGFATGLVACSCQALVNLSTAPMLLMSVLLALAGGILFSLLATRWAWRDHWTLTQALLLGVYCLAGIYVACRVVQGGSNFLECLEWLFVGPINVIAAQASTVLILLSVLRFEAPTLRTALPIADPLSA